jgi:hypothetical protein
MNITKLIDSTKSIFKYKMNISRGVLDSIVPFKVKDKQYFGEKNRDRFRLAKRQRIMNQSDPSITNEEPIPNWSEKKGKALYKFMNEFVNINRLQRKQISEKDKQQYIENSKKINLYYLNKFRIQKCYENQMVSQRDEIYNSAKLLPADLRVEIMSGRANYYDSHPIYVDEKAQENKIYEFSAENLYWEQKIRLLPDESRTVEKVLSNSFTDGDIIPIQPLEKDCDVFPEKVPDDNRSETKFKFVL